MHKVKARSFLMLLIISGMFFITGVGGNESGDAAETQLAQNEEKSGKATSGGQKTHPTTPVENSQPKGDDTATPGEGDKAPPVSRDRLPAPAGNTIDPKVFVPPAQGYWIEVTVAEQRVRIYQDDDLIKEWLASSGTPDKPTPRGVFKIQNRGDWFYSQKYQEGGRWWVSFKDWGVYLFHSVPMDRQQKIIAAEAGRLGTPASHGCVRLATENAKWIYDHIPQGTPVYIH